MNSPDIQLVVFDLGGVIVRIHRNLEQALSATGIAVHDHIEQRANDERVQTILEEYEKGLISLDDFAMRLSPLLDLSCETIIKAIDGWLLGLYEGAEQLPHAIRAQGIRTCCMSNTVEHHWQQMTGGKHYQTFFEGLDDRFASPLLGMIKPEPDIYQHVERETGMAPESILYFDDTQANIDTANKRGWHGECVDPNDPVPQIKQHLKNYCAIEIEI